MLRVEHSGLPLPQAAGEAPAHQGVIEDEDGGEESRENVKTDNSNEHMLNALMEQSYIAETSLRMKMFVYWIVVDWTNRIILQMIAEKVFYDKKLWWRNKNINKSPKGTELYSDVLLTAENRHLGVGKKRD